MHTPCWYFGYSRINEAEWRSLLLFLHVANPHFDPYLLSKSEVLHCTHAYKRVINGKKFCLRQIPTFVRHTVVKCSSAWQPKRLATPIPARQRATPDLFSHIYVLFARQITPPTARSIETTANGISGYAIRECANNERLVQYILYSNPLSISAIKRAHYLTKELWTTSLFWATSALSSYETLSRHIKQWIRPLREFSFQRPSKLTTTTISLIGARKRIIADCFTHGLLLHFSLHNNYFLTIIVFDEEHFYFQIYLTTKLQ